MSATPRTSAPRTTGPARRRLAALATALLGLTMTAALVEPVAARTPTATATAAAVAPAAARTLATPAGRVTVPTFKWRACRDGFQCARVRVPLDYDRPDGPTIVLAVVRLPAGDPARRIGSLFLNPGGPGGSGVEIARGLAPVLPLELRGRFDIIGFDPRGIMQSTPLRCYRTFGQAIASQPRITYPQTPRQETRYIRKVRRFSEDCRRDGGPMVAHMSTAEVARDMDLLREALGDEEMNFLGYSYGSILGQTYANLFPGRSRAIVVDGVLDPVAWSTGAPGQADVPVTSRIRSAAGARDTLRAFFRLCDAAGSRCAFSGGAEARYQRLARRLARKPLDFGDGSKFRYRDLVALTLGGLYSSYAFPGLGQALRDLEAADAAGFRRSLARLRADLGLAREQQPYPNFIEGFPGVLCSDSTNPRSYRRWRTAADETQATQGRFGRLWLWAGAPCGSWAKRAGKDRFDGPWTAATANPVLVVGNRYDPATPYSGAQAAARLLPNSALLTYAGWGHTAFFSGNYCVDAAVTDYFVTGATPPAGTVCQPAGSPFATPVARRPKAARALATALAPTVPAAVRQVLR